MQQPEDQMRIVRFEHEARSLLAQGRPEAALMVIDRCHHLTQSLRLLRNVCRLLVGQTGSSHLDLCRWSSEHSAPLEARWLLAQLEADATQFDNAVAALLRNIRFQEDIPSLTLLTILATQRERPEQARRWARRLRAEASPGCERESIELLLSSLGLATPATDPQPPQEQVQTLAMELAAHEKVIGPLVEAQAIQFDRTSARLLESALESILEELIEPQLACLALARLAMLDHRFQVARRWCQRTLELDPECSEAQEILRRCDELPTVLGTIGPTAALERAA